MTTMELIPNFAATPVPPFVSDPRYVSSGRALADLWPESPHAARNLNEAHNRMVYEDDTSVMPYIEALTENHTVHLNEITKGLDSEVAKQDGMVSQRFDKGDVSFFAESKRGVRRSPLDLTALGLPPFQSTRRDEKLQPLAVIVHSAKKPVMSAQSNSLLRVGKE